MTGQFHTPYYLVAGLGRAGAAMARFLAGRGESVVATDLDPAKAETAGALEKLGVSCQIGYHRQETFDKAHTIIASPGIPLDTPYLARAMQKQVAVTGELDMFQKYNMAPVLAVTGTNGKTTVATLMGDILSASGFSVFVGGNIGAPLVEAFDAGHDFDYIVAEVSSFGLDLSSRFKPDIAVLLNISEDHLDRYDGFKAYADAKWSIFKNQAGDNLAVINPAIGRFGDRVEDVRSRVWIFSGEDGPDGFSGARIEGRTLSVTIGGMTTDIRVDHPGLPGRHNMENAAAAVLACLGAGVSVQAAAGGLRRFAPLPHRIEYAGALNDVRFYNDSKGTNTDAVLRALECFDRDIVLILGGRDKGADFRLLEETIRQKVKTIIAFGECKAEIKRLFSGVRPVIGASTMAAAVKKAFGASHPGGVVLLSPACTSFDMYDSYEDRGDDFKREAAALGVTAQ